MASFLKSPEAKNVMLSIVASVIAGTVTIYLAGTYMANKASQATIARTMTIQNFNRPLRTEYIGNTGNVDNVGNTQGLSNTNAGYLPTKQMSSKPSINIVTNEYYNDSWNPILVHSFYGDNNEQIENLVAVHRMGDPFFDASFKGTFNWKGTDIKLKNTIEYN
jgi:hypothetical protein